MTSEHVHGNDVMETVYAFPKLPGVGEDKHKFSVTSGLKTGIISRKWEGTT